MINPTGKAVRIDSAGSGEYGAARGARIHKGTDYLCDVGQPVVSPISGRIVREARPYGRSHVTRRLITEQNEYSGVLIQGKNCAVKMFYLRLLPGIIGEYVTGGTVVGYAQDISLRYSDDMRPHIHLQVDSFNPERIMHIESGGNNE